MIAGGEITTDDPRRPDVRALIGAHVAFGLETTPPEHCFTFGVDALLDPAVTFFTFRARGELLGMGAIREHDPAFGEIKSMHTAAAARGRGVARALLTHLLAVARSRGYRRVSLETGTTAEFAAARALYSSAGFVPCEPFAHYKPSPDNYYMTLTLHDGSPDVRCPQHHRGLRRPLPPGPLLEPGHRVERRPR